MNDATKRMIARDLAAGPTVLPKEREPMTVTIGITNEMIAAARSAGQRYFIDEIGGEYFMIPIHKRMAWYAYDRRLEDTCEPEPRPDYAHRVETLCHLEFAMPQEPFK